MITIAPKRVSREAALANSPVAPKSRFEATDPEHESHEVRRYTLACKYLGGTKFWPSSLSSKSDLHAAIMYGVPYASLLFFVARAKTLDVSDVVEVLGISTRTLRRQSETPAKPMPPHLASKVWLLAEILAKAAEVIGSREEAESWMSRPAIGLDGLRPLDMLQTVQGAELVSDLLTRLEYGVYS